MNALYNLLWLLLALILQIVVFNHLPIFGGIALVYVIVLIKMPVELNRNLQILIGFLAGLLLDVFCNTIGMHALAATTLMWMRIPILHLFINAEDVKDGVPGFTRIGVQEYIRFALVLVIFHSLMLYFIEAFTLFNFLVILSKIIISSILTMGIAIALEFTTLKK